MRGSQQIVENVNLQTASGLGSLIESNEELLRKWRRTKRWGWGAGEGVGTNEQKQIPISPRLPS